MPSLDADDDYVVGAAAVDIGAADSARFVAASACSVLSGTE